MGFGSETQDNERILGKNKTERGWINSTPWYEHTFLWYVPEKVVFTPFGTGTKELQRLYSVTYRESFFHCHAVIHCPSLIGICCLKYSLKDSLSKNYLLHRHYLLALMSFQTMSKVWELAC